MGGMDDLVACVLKRFSWRPAEHLLDRWRHVETFAAEIEPDDHILDVFGEQPVSALTLAQHLGHRRTFAELMHQQRRQSDEDRRDDRAEQEVEIPAAAPFGQDRVFSDGDADDDRKLGDDLKGELLPLTVKRRDDRIKTR